MVTRRTTLPDARSGSYRYDLSALFTAVGARTYGHAARPTAGGQRVRGPVAVFPHVAGPISGIITPIYDI